MGPGTYPEYPLNWRTTPLLNQPVLSSLQAFSQFLLHDMPVSIPSFPIPSISYGLQNQFKNQFPVPLESLFLLHSTVLVFLPSYIPYFLPLGIVVIDLRTF